MNPKIDFRSKSHNEKIRTRQSIFCISLTKSIHLTNLKTIHNNKTHLQRQIGSKEQYPPRKKIIIHKTGRKCPNLGVALLGATSR